MLSPYQKSVWKNSQNKKQGGDIDMVALYEKATGDTLKRSGRALIGLCPFHGEDTPSFAIYEDTQSYYCFGCSESGTASWLKKQLEETDGS